MSSNPSKVIDYNPIPTSSTPPIMHSLSPPVIHLTPATLPLDLNPLLTPPTTPKPILKTRTSSTPISPISLQTQMPSPPPADPHNPHPSLQFPLQKHLALLHPQTPGEIINFCAIRLLSTDRPHGHNGNWVPIYEKDRGVEVDLATAGVGLDAAKGYSGKRTGRSEEVDERLEGMYRVARESWGLLECKSRERGAE